MQKSMRYYIVKTEDQPVVRSVAVARAEMPRPAVTTAADSTVTMASPRRYQIGHGRPLSGVARLMRSAMRRTEPDQ